MSFHLRKITLSNYRSIRDCTIEFETGLNVIIGRNGSGKTNLLQLIDGFYFGLPAEEMRLSKGTFEFEGQKKYRVEYGPSYSDDLVRGDDSPVEYKLYVNGDLVNLPTDSNADQWMDLINWIDQEESAPFILYSNFIKHGVPANLACWSVPMHNKVAIKSEKDVNANTLIRLFILNPNSTSHVMYNAIRWLIRSQLKKFSSGYWHDAFELVKADIALMTENLSKLFAEYSTVEAIRLNPMARLEHTSDKELELKNFYFDFFSEGSWRSFNQLSDGSRRVVYILSQLSEYPEILFGKRNPKEIILIEEPELAIHPKLLKRLMRFIKEVAVERQVIVTTHSPEVLDLISAEELNRIVIAEYDLERGSVYRKMDELERHQAKEYMKEMFLSDFWKYSDFNS